MKPRNFSHFQGPNGPPKSKSARGAGAGGLAKPPEPNTILLISDDSRLHQALRALANEHGRMVVRVRGLAGTVDVIHVLRPAVILLDLDLPDQLPWQAGDAMLDQKQCPPLLLLTSKREPFDLRTATRAGSVIDKTKGPWRVLEAVDQVLALSAAARAERNAVQRVLLRWLRPQSWSIPAPALRDLRVRND